MAFEHPEIRLSVQDMADFGCMLYPFVLPWNLAEKARNLSTTGDPAAGFQEAVIWRALVRFTARLYENLPEAVRDPLVKQTDLVKPNRTVSVEETQINSGPTTGSSSNACLQNQAR